MNFVKTYLIAAASITVFAGALAATAATLSTPLTGGNGQSGIMFDIAV